MVFFSIPTYLDPSTWQQQQQQQQNENHPTLHHGSSSISISPNLSISNPLLSSQPLSQPPPAHSPPHTGPMSSSIRPGSMAERARMANIPMPEAGLKCPRCESTSTKFCYFNNYSLSQPRHFCKTCRRYWTRGGAVRNKRSKSSSSASKSSASSAAAVTSAASLTGGGGSSSVADIVGHLTPPSPLSSLRFMSPLHHLTDFGGGGGVEWRVPQPPPAQLPFLGGLDAAGGGRGLYRHPFEGVEFSGSAIGGSSGPARRRAVEPVKMEGRGQEVGLGRQFSVGMSRTNGGERYDWGGESSSSGNAWTDLSALNNSYCSTTSAL